MEKIILEQEKIYRGNLILVNKKYSLKFSEKEDAVSLVPISKEYPNILLENRTATMLSYLIKEVKCQGDIVYVSGYRTLSEQVKIYEDSLLENGVEFTKKYVALPNHSEHQTGLAIDLGKIQQGKDLAECMKEIDFIRPEFPYTGIYQTFRNNAYKYGFIERYQRGKEKITGIGHEPWHFRYVGYPHAKIMVDKDFALEEYIEFLKNYTYEGEHMVFGEQNKRIEIFYVNLEDKKTKEIEIPKESICQISGNNVDGCVITLWRNGNGMA
jgi:D-alanyl-D-alanine dipeptidase/carboxypeptidase